MFWIHFALLLGIIFIGIRYGGMALGLLGGLGVSILAFVFGVVPGSPPVSVMLIILAVVAASAALEVTGGLTLLVQVAERLLRRRPEKVAYLAPVCTWSLTTLVGTGHSVYPLLPVIYDVAYSKGIRPERPMAIATVASQMGITASPIAAAAAVVLATTATNNVSVSLLDILSVTIPATLMGVLIAATWSVKRGLELADDPEFQARLADPDQRAYIEGGQATTLDKAVTREAKIGLGVFLAGIAAIVVVALFPALLPVTESGKPLSLSVALQFMMLTVGGLILLSTRIKTADIPNSSVFKAGMTAVITVFGIAWFSDTIVAAHKPYIIEQISDMVAAAPWTFAIAMFAVSMFLKSQAATLTVMLPMGFVLGVDPKVMIGVLPACYAYFVFCFYPSDLAAINFDRSGTTRIGRFIFNHSFMLPGLIGVGSATVIGYLLATTPIGWFVVVGIWALLTYVGQFSRYGQVKATA
ncbi:anaerobic C4-dicarboxylate transporter [Ferrimonas marina]|uniref:C4-dicarboxylate transporter n=1 Tax=Ferrimonas marina TaxID=299255 RepID=A0A1M5XB02_9GAMM|nr:anaerobic C4-dicarboxylate transporter [Ferrimonas marina]SHH96919.1 anaerobic C4-dicarboxylate transporter DcuB [Ferrimonas marina]